MNLHRTSMSRRNNTPDTRTSLTGVQTRTSASQSKNPSPLRSRDFEKLTPVTMKPSGTAKSKDDDRFQEILNKLGKLDKLDDLEVRIDTSTKQLTDQIEANNKKTDALSKICNEVKDETTVTKTQLSVYGLRLSELETKIEQLERERRRNNLVIDGLKEVEGEDIAELVKRVFREVGVVYDTSACTNLYRRGRKPVGERERRLSGQQQQQQAPERPRSIVVVFLKQFDKSEFFRNLKNLKGKDEWKHTYFNDDHTEIQATEQRDLRSLAAYARGQGKEATVKANALWYEGRKYRYEVLHRLPPNISLLKSKTLHILDDQAIVFQSPHSPLSNLFPCNLVFRGGHFLSAEGAFHFHRALTSGYEQDAYLIKSTRNPFKVKKTANLLRATPEWERICEDVMKEILLAKFSQSEYCKKFLLDTGDRRLFEGTGDRRWACGIPISKSHLITFKNPGRNLLGFMLESTRVSLRPN